MKIRILMTLLVFSSLLTACGSKRILDFDTADVESLSVMTYDFKNEDTNISWVYKDKDKEVFLQYLSKLKGTIVDDLEYEDEVTELYAFELNTKQEERFLLYDNYLISSDGSIYQIDGNKMKEMCQTIYANNQAYDHLYYIMNHRYLSLLNNNWDSRYMYKLRFIDGPLTQVEMAIQDGVVTQSTEKIAYSIKNNTDKTIEFGDRIFFEVKVDNEWYAINDMTRMGTDIAWHDILNILEPGEERIYDFYMKYYQPLPSGRYRLVKEVPENSGNHDYLFIEFDIE